MPIFAPAPTCRTDAPINANTQAEWQTAPAVRSCAFNSGLDCISRRQDSSVITVERHPSGIVRPTPADILRSRKIEPTARARPIMPPKELKKMGRSSSFREARKSRSRCGAPGSNRPSAAIHSLQPGPHELGPPFAKKKIIGCCWMRSRIARAISRAAASSFPAAFPAALVKPTASTAHERTILRKAIMRAMQLAVAPTLQGCKFRCHDLTTCAAEP
jgi:hypothetical protein